jgi:large subunit ribosomal protein L6
VSRIGKKPIECPKGVSVSVEGNLVRVQGPLGVLERKISGVRVLVEDGSVKVLKDENEFKAEAMWGLQRTLIANMIEGVSKGFTKTLQISGIGYRAESQGNELSIYVGYSHPVRVVLPEGITASIMEKQTRIVLKSANKELLGDVAARIRRLRPVDPYKAKGIMYLGEKVRRKAGKKGVGSAS